MSRSPYDGKPYYCRNCGEPFHEVQNCTDDECELETPEIAALRASRRKAVGSDCQRHLANAAKDS